VTRLSDALVAYGIRDRTEGKSPCTIGWVTSSVGYFGRFLRGDPEISSITADDLRRLIITLQNTDRFRDHSPLPG
jgi:hypothetical protein